MNATTALVLTMTALVLAPVVGADDEPQPVASGDASCEWFYYSIDPPGFQFDPTCIGPSFDKSP